MSALRRKNFTPSKTAVVCSRHFAESDIDRTSLVTVRIRENAVPSIFEQFPSYLQKKVKQRKPPKERSAKSKIESTVFYSDLAASALTAPESSSGIHTSPTPSMSSLPHTNNQEDTPRRSELKRKLFQTEQKLLTSRKKIKVLLQTKRRLVKKNASLISIIADLKNHNLLSTESLSVLENSACGVNDLIKRKILKCLNQSTSNRYSPELRSFALTLYFYSPHAYRYVRKMFDTCLPHPRTIEKWFQGVQGQPGYTSDAFTALRARALHMSAIGKALVCSLVMDEIAIRQHVEWDGKKYHGYIDLGTQLNDDSLPLAKEALTFMVVAINDSFKMPVGYFLIDGLGANITCEFLRKLHDAGITIASLTFDGCASNICMVRNLGCNLDIKSFKPYFSHPVTNENVLIFLDPCHMLKLVRNTLGDKKRLVDRDGNVVDWKFIENLNQLQQDENLHLANKRRPKHLLWTKNKMNVNLAAQLLSESVASSLEFCAQEHMANFIGCEPTVKFIRIVNGLLDVFTSRNLKAKGLKSPLQPCNYFTIR